MQFRTNVSDRIIFHSAVELFSSNWIVALSLFLSLPFYFLFSYPIKVFAIALIFLCWPTTVWKCQDRGSFLWCTNIYFVALCCKGAVPVPICDSRNLIISLHNDVITWIEWKMNLKAVFCGGFLFYYGLKSNYVVDDYLLFCVSFQENPYASKFL